MELDHQFIVGNKYKNNEEVWVCMASTFPIYVYKNGMGTKMDFAVFDSPYGVRCLPVFTEDHYEYACEDLGDKIYSSNLVEN